MRLWFNDPDHANVAFSPAAFRVKRPADLLSQGIRTTGAHEWETPHQGGCFNEASRFFEGFRNRCRGGGARLAGDCAVLAGNQMAHDLELPKIAGHALWRVRGVREIRRRDD